MNITENLCKADSFMERLGVSVIELAIACDHSISFSSRMTLENGDQEATNTLFPRSGSYVDSLDIPDRARRSSFYMIPPKLGLDESDVVSLIGKGEDDIRLSKSALRPVLLVVSADRMQCPIDYPAVGAMVSLAAVVGRQISPWGLRGHTSPFSRYSCTGRPQIEAADPCPPAPRRP